MTTTRPGGRHTDEPSTRDLYRTAFGSRTTESEEDGRTRTAGTTEGPARSGAVLAAALTFVAGGWLVVAPYVLGYADLGGFDGYWNSTVFGAIVAVVALVLLADPARVLTSVLALASGAWLLAAPFRLGYSSSAPLATWNETITGAVVVVLAAAGLVLGFTGRRSGGHAAT